MLKRNLMAFLAAFVLAGTFSIPAFAEEPEPFNGGNDIALDVPAPSEDLQDDVLGEPTSGEQSPASEASVLDSQDVDSGERSPASEAPVLDNQDLDLGDLPAPDPAPATDSAPEEVDPQEELDARAAASVGVIEDDTYYIRSLIGDRQAIDVSNKSMNDGGNVIAWKWNGGDNQKWEVTHDSIGYASLRSVLSGQLLTVDGTDRGANVCQRADIEGEGAESQKWIIEAASGGRGYVLISALSPSLVLDLTNNTSKDGTNVEVWTDKNGMNQAFDFVDATPEVAESTADIEDGYYGIRSSVSPNVIDVANKSTADNANVCSWTANNGFNQLFKIEKRGGYYTIAASHSDKTIGMAENCPISGVNVVQTSSSAEQERSLFAAVDNGDGTVTFINVATGLALSLNGSSSGSNLIGSNVDGDGLQSFQLVRKTNLLSEGMYEIVPATNGNMRLDVSNHSRSDGANVALWTNNGGQNQKWDIQLVPGLDNTYTIQAVVSGAYLAVDGSDVGDNVNQQDIDPSNAAAQWIPSLAGGKVSFLNVATGLALDVTGCGSNAGTNIEIWSSNTSVAQRFTLSNTAPIKDGCFFIEFAVDSTQVVDISGKSTHSGGNAISYANNGGANQKWYFQRQSDGTYLILNAYSELPLGISGTNVQQLASNSTSGVKWSLIYNHDGTFSIVNASNNAVVLSVGGGTPQNLANAELQADEGNDGQRFTFTATSYSGGSLGLTGAKLAMYKLAQGYSSPTDWLILIDNEDCWVGVFRWYDGRWNYERYFRCSNGKYSTPTVRGTFYTYTRGYTFGSDQGHACYWYTGFYGDYLFHSTLYQPYSFDHLDNRLGMHLSNGCVRLQIDNAKYIYDNVPLDTRVVSYN